MYDPARDTYTKSDDVTADQVTPSVHDGKSQSPSSHGSKGLPDGAPKPEKVEHSLEPLVQVKTVDGHGDREKKHKAPYNNIESKQGSHVALNSNRANYESHSVKPRDSETIQSSSAPSGKKRHRSPDSPPIHDRRGTTSGQSPKVTNHDESHRIANSDLEPPEKKARPSSPRPQKPVYESAVPLTAANLPRIRKKTQTASPNSRVSGSPSYNQHKRSQSPERQANDHRRRLRRSPSPPARLRSPTPPPRSPPRERKRPGGASRISNAEKDAIRQRQEEREEAQRRTAASRGVQDVVRQHYNQVPERGREWRKTDSRIRGLRSFNNWVKSSVIQRFAPDPDFVPESSGPVWAEDQVNQKFLKVLDIGCGKGGDLQKWQQSPQPLELYVGVDPADVSIEQARERFNQMRHGGGRGGRGGHRGVRNQRLFHAEFVVEDAFGEGLANIPIIEQVGIDKSVGPGGGAISSRWGGGGFDVVSMMFCMHYAYENEVKARQMLRNVAGALKKGGRLIGVIPNSDMLTERVLAFHERQKNNPGANANSDPEDGEVPDTLEWGNDIYHVRFPPSPALPPDGIFRPPYGWRYNYHLEEAVEAPEYVVPWEAFRAIAEDYNLELEYRRTFQDVWQEEKAHPVLGPLSERMGVRERGGGKLLVSDEEMEAASFYLAFCFHKV